MTKGIEIDDNAIIRYIADNFMITDFDKMINKAETKEMVDYMWQFYKGG